MGRVVPFIREGADPKAVEDCKCPTCSMNNWQLYCSDEQMWFVCSVCGAEMMSEWELVLDEDLIDDEDNT